MPTIVAASLPTVAAIGQADPNSPLRALTEERASQRAQLNELFATVDDLSGHTDGDSTLAREMAERSIVRSVEVIAYIEHALEKLATGLYGICEQCQQPIAQARLEAIPYARHCVSCPSPPPRLAA